MFLIIIFVPPLYFVIRNKWGAFMLNGFLYLLAWLTVLFFGLGVIFWALAVGHAAWHLRYEWMEKQAELIAKKTKEGKAVSSPLWRLVFNTDWVNDGFRICRMVTRSASPTASTSTPSPCACLMGILRSEVKKLVILR